MKLRVIHIKDTTSLNKISVHPNKIKELGVVFGPIKLRSTGANTNTINTKGTNTTIITTISVDFSLKDINTATLFTCNKSFIEFNDCEFDLEIFKKQDIVCISRIIVEITSGTKADEYLKSFIIDTLLRLEYFTTNTVLVDYNGQEISVLLKFITTTKEGNSSGVYKVNNNTEFQFMKHKKKDGVKVGGYATQIKQIIQYKNTQKTFEKFGFSSKGVLIYGVRGVGKSSVGKLLSDYTITPEMTFQEIESIFQESNEEILFIDDLDLVCKKYEITKLIDEFDGFIVAACCDLYKVPATLRRIGRFDKTIELEVPDPIGRLEILKILLEAVECDFQGDDLRKFALGLHGYVGSDLSALVKEAIYISQNIEDLSDQLSSLSLSITNGNTQTKKLKLSHLISAKSIIRPSAMKEISLDIPNVYFRDIGGQELIKQSLNEAILWPLKHPEKFTKLGISAPKGILLYGPPGCSKTMLAKALATEAGLNFFAIKGPEIFNMWVGESERAVRDLFKKARRAKPSIIFLDEIDSIAQTRGSDGGGGVGDRVLTTLLTEIDGVETLEQVTIVGATNRPDVIDPALKRPGRLDRILYVPPPDYKAREQIVGIQMKKSVWDNVDIGVVVEKTENWTGAEIVNLCREAAIMAVREGKEVVEGYHFNECFKTMKPRLNTELLKFYEDYAHNKQTGLCLFCFRK